MICINEIEYPFPKGKIVYEIKIKLATCGSKRVEANSREEVLKAVDHWLFDTSFHNLKKFDDCPICRANKVREVL